MNKEAMNLIERLNDEADLCRNEGANDIAVLLDEAAKALSAPVQDGGVDALVALARADEREACAKLCDDLPAPNSCSGSESSLWDVATLECAAAIRARGDDAA